MTNILKNYGTNLKIAGGAIPLEWFTPPKSGQKLLRAKMDKKTNKDFNRKTVLVAVATVVVIIQGIVEVKKGIIDPIAWMMVGILITCLTFLQFWRTKSPDVAVFINALIQFDQMYPKKQRKYKDMKLLEIARASMVYLLLLARAFFPPALIFGLHWSNPWKSSLAGNWLIMRPGNSEQGIVLPLVTFGVKLAVMLFNTWTEYLAVTAASSMYGAVYNLCITALIRNIDLFATFCTCQVYKGKEMTIYRRATIFRHIQLLSETLNEFQRGPLVVVAIAGPIVVGAFSLSSLVKTAPVGFFLVAVPVFVVVTCITALTLIFGQMAILYTKSNRIVQIMRTKMDMPAPPKEQKWEHKFYKSCSPLKVMIGATNFVDALTPLNSLILLVSLAANILLLGK